MNSGKKAGAGAVNKTMRRKPAQGDIMEYTTKIKVCGLTRPEEVEYLTENQADYGGMVLFFPKSKRNISLDQAKEILKEFPKELISVAVTVSPTTKQLEILTESGFDRIQIHAAFPDRIPKNCVPLIKAFNISDLGTLPQYISDPRVCGFVFDAATPGSGVSYDLSILPPLPKEKPVLLAGGLDPRNVAEAIRVLRPYGVDVSSGVEFQDRPGKDPERIRAFVRAVREAYAPING